MTHSLPITANIALPPILIPNSKNPPNRKQLISLLQSCRHSNQITPIHAKIIRNNYHNDAFVVFELLRVCSNLSSINYASKIFSFTENPNVYLYTALIDGFVLSGSFISGIHLYYQMINLSIVPDNYVITSVLEACGFQLALKQGIQVHCQVLKLGLSSKRLMRLKLMKFYGKCGSLKDAERLFDEMPERDVVASTIMINSYFEHGLIQEAIRVFNLNKSKDTVCWTAVIDGLVRNGEMNRALEVFREMQREDVRPNEVTIVCVLSACSQLGTLELGRWVHSYMGKYGIGINHFVGGALINMYSRCGDIDEAWRVFEEMKERNVITYNSMIVGFSLHGKSSEAIELFRGMTKQGLEPTSVTFVGVLNACSHGGLADLGFEIFNSMARDYKVEPQIEHYGCMVDLLGRLGRVEEGYDFIKTMRVAPDHVMLGALLSACKIHGNVELGEEIARSLVDCGNADSGTYVLLSNVYSSSGKWKEAAQVRAEMKQGGMEKEPGCSSIEVNNKIHEFLLGDIRHPQKEAIYKKLEELNQRLTLEGYTPETEVVLHDIENWEKERALAIHSERLAICYGLISSEAFTTIRVVKNLRVCNDCHSMIKLISKITKRKIVVRDRNRFHHFEHGTCSCGDYW
ncbi:putative pentatricopeptide repeat-containing protein At5g59200, chloroplastic [Ricinus communis]|uniref:putative pentatricopeptide repeat-containing protein At5g59200, chloroplastic n=1 Tax=Ricinus communis TaxID=3988 RepID=UPI00201A2A81|nr:putative pentatricopeptide repeat-containing protein At5g59200, chloroplastic [Ricinus communis]XP_015579721.2 putative pentatricopeptide repeat-containing protein At5g59200, chloroplastic [Ricinus communis]XP_015579722.2 putative pentatricopeptide repeat-containing protein At5g59200, chloroplastic [Ricinus communis]XP_015579725.2 putative pentatricopeptide repeat-containing protein At5g59200, chloroplastic [Ricinus communis]XP_015579726.2 putative pentatricopeptide repeat-containing protein